MTDNFLSKVFGQTKPPSLAELIADALKPMDTDEIRKRAAWEKTSPLGALQAAYMLPDARLDALGNIVCWSHYGRHDSLYGWDIDHIVPKAQGGRDELSNLRALKCSTNRSLGGLLGQAFRRN